MWMLLLAARLALPARAQGDDAVHALIQQARLIQPAAGAAAAVWELLPDEALPRRPYHTDHAALFGRYAVGYNREILRAVDEIQAKFPDGGGYFTGVHANPPESPIGYAVALFGRALLKPPRPTSFCTGATYTAFIEALNLIFAGSPPGLTPERFEALRMQEPDGSRREDHVKFWGHWNADNAGPEYALVQYAKMGVVVPPEQARAGDFMSVLWKNGGSHSTVFLGWHKAAKGAGEVLFWASNTPKTTDGVGDRVVPLSEIAGVKFVRLTKPDALTTFAVDAPVDPNVGWDRVSWPFAESAHGGRRRSRRR